MTRTFLPLAGAALASLIAATPASALPFLPWPSGSKDGVACLEQLRGAAIGVQHWHVTPPDFPAMVSSASGWVSQAVRASPAPLVLLSFALLPEASRGRFADCAVGAFDPYWRQIGAALSKIAGHAVVVEPGWEANIGSGPHPWGVDHAWQLPAYKACFQHAAAALRSTFPAGRIAWTNARRYHLDYSADEMNPGDASFDVYGMMAYDSAYNPRPQPKLPMTQATWDRTVDSHDGTGGTPSGIGSWLAYAQAHGKLLGVSEWGIKDVAEVTTAQADDPLYVRNMASFLRANAGSIAYEAYQNNNLTGLSGHELCPATLWPNARDEYARDFRPTGETR